ncbi:MAG: M20 family metallopeptidase [Chloroflexi bacterium]|nr:M20 family metallopeptidase [Chloroflexota bacterium]
MKKDLSAITSFLSQQRDRFLEDLATLVNIDCGTYDKAGVDKVGRWVATRLEEMGAEVTRYPQEVFGDLLLGRWRGAGTARVLIIAHLDTVYPAGTVAERPLRIDGDRAIGPGTCDIKGGLLVALYAVAALQRSGFDNFAEILLWTNSEEEIGSPVSHHLTTKLARECDAVLVMEPARANGDIVSARKATARYVVTVHGQSAHAGVEPEKGANAILEMAHSIIALHELNGLRPGVTINAGVISGGTRYNAVPDRAELKVDARAVDDEAAAEVQRAISAFAGPGRHVAGTTIEVQGGVDMPAMPLRPGTQALVALAQDVARDLGFALHDTATGGGSDGNFAAAAGAPVLDGLGPIGGRAHSPDEYLEISSFVPRTALLAGLMMRIANHRER